MNSINIGWDSTKQAEMPYFHCGISGQKGNERKWKTGKTKKNKKQKQKKHLRMNKSKENTLIYEHMYIYTHSQTFKQINIDAHIHIFT